VAVDAITFARAGEDKTDVVAAVSTDAVSAGGLTGIVVTES
jgi:hypothetical protein